MFIAASLRRLLAGRFLALGLLAGGAAIVALPQSASAQSTKIAVVNVQRVYNDMQETKAMTVRMAEEGKKLNAEMEAKAQELQKLRAERDDKDHLKPGTPQWEEVNQKLITKSVELKNWRDSKQALQEDAYKQQVKKLFEKVEAAVAEVAKAEGYDIVIADTSAGQDALDQADLRTLKAMLLQKSVLFANDKSDITQRVIISLDGKYKAAAQGK
jgi:Skp family chaperone for outer membrane proteins